MILHLLYIVPVFFQSFGEKLNCKVRSNSITHFAPLFSQFSPQRAKLQFPIEFTSDNFPHKFPGHQGSIDWYPGIQDGRKWRQREEMGGKISPTRGKKGFFAFYKDKNGPNRARMAPKGLKIVFFCTKCE